MNLRVLRTELLRSAAPWAGLLVLAGGLGLLYALNGPGSSTRWNGQWTSLALWTRVTLAYVWPLVAGVGALYALRDHRSRMPELLTSTPRPVWQRAAAPATAIALALTAGFVTLLLWGGVGVLLGTTTFTTLGWLPISAVGLLALVAAALFGMGVARTLPSPLTPPLVVVVLLAVNVTLMQNSDGRLPAANIAPHVLSQLSPVVAQPRELLLTLTGAVHLGQTLWLLGLLATGFGLLTATRVRTRLTAVVPALAGAVLALLVLPGDPAGSYRVDTAAASPACEGPVCVSEIHHDRLAALAPTATEALRVLDKALGDDAPRRVREETAPRALAENRRLDPASVLVHFEDPQIGAAKGEQLLRRLVGEGIAPSCWGRTSRESGSDESLVTQSVLASWALGEFRLIDADVYNAGEYRASAREAWRRFMALAPAERRSRAVEVREAALGCEFTYPEDLTGGSAR